MQPKTIKSKNNGCGTAPANLFLNIYAKVKHHIQRVTRPCKIQIFKYKVFKE